MISGKSDRWSVIEREKRSQREREREREDITNNHPSSILPATHSHLPTLSIYQNHLNSL